MQQDYKVFKMDKNVINAMHIYFSIITNKTYYQLWYIMT